MHQREEQGSGEQGVEVRGREVLGKAMTSRGGGGGGGWKWMLQPQTALLPKAGCWETGEEGLNPRDGKVGAVQP